MVVSHALLRGRHEGGQQAMGRRGQAHQETLTSKIVLQFLVSSLLGLFQHQENVCSSEQ